MIPDILRQVTSNPQSPIFKDSITYSRPWNNKNCHIQGCQEKKQKTKRAVK